MTLEEKPGSDDENSPFIVTCFGCDNEEEPEMVYIGNDGDIYRYDCPKCGNEILIQIKENYVLEQKKEILGSSTYKFNFNDPGTFTAPLLDDIEDESEEIISQEEIDELIR